MSFESLGLCAEILRAVSESGYTQPTPIQEEAIPYVLAGRDLMAGAQTGTGKTAGFTLPIIQRLITSKTKGRPVRALIIVPTRELAAQVHENVMSYSQHSDIRSTVVFGGVSIRPQITKLQKGVDILIATPGRLLDLVNQGHVELSQVESLVLDEADRMLDMGFIPDVKRILNLVPESRQTLLFSATFSSEIKHLANTFLDNPAQVQIAQQNTTAEKIEQKIYLVDQKQKRDLLSFLIGTNDWSQVLIFTRTKHGANRLATQLDKDGIKSAAIHGNKSQGARTRALHEFKQGKIKALVATDIAARGLDIDQLPHVVNFELPHKPEDYVHRIGRTGRAGREGEAISLVCREETKLLRDIERLLKRQLPQKIEEDYEPMEPALTKEGAPQNEMNKRSSNRGRTNNRSNRNSNRSANGRQDTSRSNGPKRGGRGRSNPNAVSQQAQGADGNRDQGNKVAAPSDVDGNRKSDYEDGNRTPDGNRKRSNNRSNNRTNNKQFSGNKSGSRNQGNRRSEGNRSGSPRPRRSGGSQQANVR